MSNESPGKWDAVFLKASENVIRDTLRPLVVELKRSYEREARLSKESLRTGAEAGRAADELLSEQDRISDKINAAIESLHIEARRSRISRQTEELVIGLANALSDVLRSSAGEIFTNKDFDPAAAPALLKAHGIEPVLYDYDE